MDCLLIGGAQSVGKTEAIFRLTQNLLTNGFKLTAGTVPATVADFTAILEGPDKSGQQIRILVNTATDTVNIINRLRHFYDNNGTVNILISSIRDHDFWPRADFFRIMNISPVTNHITEFPLAKITRRGTRFRTALNWYIQNIDLMIRQTLSLAPFNVKFKLWITNTMNEWGFIGQDSYVGIGKSATSFKFKSRCGYVREERLVLSNSHSS